MVTTGCEYERVVRTRVALVVGTKEVAPGCGYEWGWPLAVGYEMGGTGLWV